MSPLHLLIRIHETSNLVAKLWARSMLRVEKSVYLLNTDTIQISLKYSFSGFCCIDYSVCDQDGAFSLSTPSVATDLATMGVGATGTSCVMDHINIEGSSETCDSPVTFNKYCGDFLSSNTAMAAINSNICGK